MDEEEIGGLGALSSMMGGGGGELDDDAKSYAMSILRDKSSQGATDDTFKSLESDAAMARQALQRARERLMGRPAYDQRDKYLAVAGALLGGGSTSGHFGDGVGRAATALLGERKAERAAQGQRDTEEFSLDKELYGVDSSVNAAKRTLALKREELDTNLKGRALAALKGGKGATINGVPMSVKETEWFIRQTPERQRQHLLLKRANQVRTVAGVETVVDPTGGTRPLTDIGTVRDNAATVAGAEAGARETGTFDAKTIATAKESLPKAIQASKDLVGLIDGVAAHPGLEGGVGLSPGRVKEYIWGTDVRDFVAKNEQLNSNAFVSIIQDVGTMVGLTNIEGDKLQRAKVNLDRAQSPKQYREALKTFKMQSQRTTKLLEEKLARAQAAPQPGQPAAFDIKAAAAAERARRAAAAAAGAAK